MHDASVNSEPGSNSPLKLFIFTLQERKDKQSLTASCWLLTLLFWINLVSYFWSIGLNLWALNCFALRLFHFKSPIRTLLSNFQRAKFPLCLFLFAEKSNWKFILTSSQLHLLQRYSNKIFTNLSSLFLKNFSIPARQLLTTLILKHISMRFVKLFLQPRCACFTRLEK